MSADIDVPDLPAHIRDVDVEACDHDYVETDRKKWEYPSGKPVATVIYHCRDCYAKLAQVEDRKQSKLGTFQGAET